MLCFQVLLRILQANIHSFLESDDRIALVLQYMDGAIAELDSIGTLVSSYKIHLNVRMYLGFQVF